MKRLRVVGTRTPEGRIHCKVYRLVGREAPVFIGDFLFDEIQWYRFKQEAEWRNKLDETSGPHYEFQSDWVGGNSVVGQALEVGIREDGDAAHRVGFTDRVEYELHPSADQPAAIDPGTGGSSGHAD